MARARTRPAATPAAPDAEEKATAKAKAEAERLSKTKARGEQDAALLAQILKRHGDHPAVPGGEQGDETLAVVAKSLNITTTKAGWLLFFHAVASGKVPAITAKSDEELVKKIHAARVEAGRFSAWGWLAARSDRSESWIKTKLHEAGLYEPRSENIASVRAEANPKPAKKEKAEGGEPKPKGRARPKGNAS